MVHFEWGRNLVGSKMELFIIKLNVVITISALYLRGICTKFLLMKWKNQKGSLCHVIFGLLSKEGNTFWRGVQKFKIQDEKFFINFFISKKNVYFRGCWKKGGILFEALRYRIFWTIKGSNDDLGCMLYSESACSYQEQNF